MVVLPFGGMSIVSGSSPSGKRTPCSPIFLSISLVMLACVTIKTMWGPSLSAAMPTSLASRLRVDTARIACAIISHCVWWLLTSAKTGRLCGTRPGAKVHFSSALSRVESARRTPLEMAPASGRFAATTLVWSPRRSAWVRPWSERPSASSALASPWRASNNLTATLILKWSLAFLFADRTLNDPFPYLIF